MPNLLFPLMMLIALYRSLKHMFFDFFWWRKKDTYVRALAQVCSQIDGNKNLVEKLGLFINPVAGLGVEDIWITRIGNIKVKDNKALVRINDNPEVDQIITSASNSQSRRLSKSTLQHHFLNALLQGWNRKDKINSSYQPAKNEILSLVNSLKKETKKHFIKLKEIESFESIHYAYSVVFYRKYTYNLYKTATAYGLIGLGPIAYYIYLQRQPYFSTIGEYVEELNQYDMKTAPIQLDDFEIGKINKYNQTREYYIMENNGDYLDGKLSRTILWIVLFSFFGPFCMLTSLSITKSRGEIDGAFVFLFLIGVFLTFLAVDKIKLYGKLRKLDPRRILKKKGLWR